MPALIADIVVEWIEAAEEDTGLVPDVSVELLLEKSAPEVGTDVYRWATRPLAGTAFIEGRVASDGYGEILRELSDEQGNHRTGTASVVINDDDGLIRQLLNTEGTEHFENREVGCKLHSFEGRFAGTFRNLFRGRVQNVQTSQRVSGNSHRRLASLEMVDALTPYLDRKIPQRVFTEQDFPGIRKDLIGKPIPLIGGEHGDTGAQDAAGNSATKGLVPAIFVGQRRTVTGVPTDTTSTPALLAAPVLSAQVIGVGGSTPYHYGVTSRSNYGETTLSDILTVLGPDVLTADNYIRLTWTGVGGSVGSVLYGRRNPTPVRRLSVFAAGVTQYDDTGVAGEFSPGPPSENTAQIETTDGAFFWDFYIVSLGVVNILQIFGSDVAKGTEPSRVDLTETAGVDTWIPGHRDWPHPDNYITLASGLRVTGFYARGPRSYHHTQGIITFAVNTCGYEDVGDGSGESIQQAFPLYQHFLNEFVLKNEGDGYASGNWGPLVAYDDATPILQTS